MKLHRSPTIVFAVLVVAFIGYVYFFEYKKDEQNRMAKQESQKLFQAKQDDVIKISMKWAGGETVLFKDDMNKWHLDVPVRDQVEEAAIDTILKGIEDESYETLISEDPNADLSIYGLKDPVGYVTIEKKDKTAQTVSFGQVDALDGKKYVLLSESKKVAVVPSFTQTRFAKSSRDFRLKKILKTVRADVTSLKVNINDKKLALSLIKGEKGWQYQDQDWEVDPKTIESYLAKVDGLAVVDFVSEDKKSPQSIKSFQTGNVLAQFELKTQAGEVEVLSVHSAREGKAFVTSSLKEFVYQVPQNSFEALKVPADYFRNKSKPFEFNKEAIERIEVKTGLSTYNLKKEGTEWKLDPTDENRVVDQQHVEKLLSSLSQLKVGSYLGLNKKISKALGSVTLRKKDDAIEFQLMWAQDLTDTERLAFSNKSQEGLSVSKSDLAMLPFQTVLNPKKAQDVAPEKK